ESWEILTDAEYQPLDALIYRYLMENPDAHKVKIGISYLPAISSISGNLLISYHLSEKVNRGRNISLRLSYFCTRFHRMEGD
ncbi:MAG: hypothetical protein LUO93_06720, partial [Methanomicrobiales archaeon]|nr:hypothetical protein [Methanomicrobiales archaeon]